VTSDDNEFEMIYEDHTGQIRSVVKEAKGQQRLWVREGGGEASHDPYPKDRCGFIRLLVKPIHFLKFTLFLTRMTFVPFLVQD
jgi:hypothetical protein